MEVFRRNLTPLPPDPDAKKETDNTFKDPDMTYYVRPTNGNGIQGMEGLQWWLSGAPTPETDGLVTFSALTVLALAFKALNEK